MKQPIVSETGLGVNPLYARRRLRAVAARWDAKAADWERNLRDPDCHLNEDNAYERFLELLSEIIRQRQDFCAGRGVIDAGCATGLVLAKVADSFRWGIGVDISTRMIESAQSKRVPHCRFLVADCFDLSAHCPKAGAVVSRGVLLSHYGYRAGEELLRSAFDCLVNQGFILWDFLNQTARARHQHAPKDKCYYEPEEARVLATKAGFRTAVIYGEPARRVRLLYAER